MRHYVYKIICNKPIDERIYYIGVKSSENPETDNYYGSSNYLNEVVKEIGIQHFSKTILSFWETRVLAEIEESRLHKQYKVASNPLYFNITRPKKSENNRPESNRAQCSKVAILLFYIRFRCRIFPGFPTCQKLLP